MAKKPKKIPDAPPAKLTLRDVTPETLADWRWPVPDRTRLRMRSRVTIGMPDEMRSVWDEQKRSTGFSLSEIGRRLTMDRLARRRGGAS